MSTPSESRVPGRLTVGSALARLERAGEREVLELLRHGTLQVEIYRPHGQDRQSPHSRDELYVVISGAGQFCLDGERRP